MAFGIKKLFKRASGSEKDSSEKTEAKQAQAHSENSEKTKDIATPKKKSIKKEKEDMTTKIQHQYIEVAADLLAKPAALCDIVESQGGNPVLVFCNNPSDADFVEVILKKRGISATKLIGFVAPDKLEATISKVKSADLAAVVVTDVAARGLDFSAFSAVVNYSLPADLDIYSTRAGSDQPGDRAILSIVSPLDFANLHQLKTNSSFELLKAEPPSKEDLAKAKMSKVKNSAASKAGSIDPTLVEMAKQINKDKDAVEVIAYLLHNLKETLPQLQAQIDKLSWEKENLEDEEDDSGQPGSRQARSRDGRNTRGRERDRDRGRRGDRDRDHRGNRSEGSDDDDSGQGRFFSSSSDDNQDHYERRREPRRPQVTKIRDDRLYIGRGLNAGFTQKNFTELLKEHCGLEADQVKRFLSRSNYSFADLPEGLANDVISKLDGVDCKGSSLYVAKATQVVTVIEAPAAQEEQLGDEQEEQPAA